ncbi:MAG TPA: hypothetical protein VH142_28905 [Polyangiaceae bacterium]|nr:hypothetical protein [Polyangiaceae bacterium]
MRLLRSLGFPCVVALSVAACGGGAKPEPETAATEKTATPPTDDSAASSDAPASDASSTSTPSDKSDKSDSASTSDSSDTGGASSDDRHTVLQLTLDDEELGSYLKLESPGRFPLKVAGENLPSGLLKAGKPIVLVDKPDPKAAVLVITAVDVGKDHATVKYRYGVEGIEGTTTLDKGPRGWEILRTRVVEHYRADKTK